MLYNFFFSGWPGRPDRSRQSLGLQQEPLRVSIACAPGKRASGNQEAIPRGMIQAPWSEIVERRRLSSQGDLPGTGEGALASDSEAARQEGTAACKTGGVLGEPRKLQLKPERWDASKHRRRNAEVGPGSIQAGFISR